MDFSLRHTQKNCDFEEIQLYLSWIDFETKEHVYIYTNNLHFSLAKITEHPIYTCNMYIRIIETIWWPFFTQSSLYHLVQVFSFTYQIVSHTQGALNGVKLVPCIYLLQRFLHHLPRSVKCSLLRYIFFWIKGFIT